MVLRFFARGSIRLIKSNPLDLNVRHQGRDWLTIGSYTTIGIQRLDNVQHLIETVLREGMPGDLCECGVWRGACAIFMRAVLDYAGDRSRSVWVADSFASLPKPDVNRCPADQWCDLSEESDLSVPLDLVKQNFERLWPRASAPSTSSERSGASTVRSKWLTGRACIGVFLLFDKH
jgi:O-methyltransferase